MLVQAFGTKIKQRGDFALFCTAPGATQVTLDLWMGRSAQPSTAIYRVAQE